MDRRADGRARRRGLAPRLALSQKQGQRYSQREHEKRCDNDGSGMRAAHMASASVEAGIDLNKQTEHDRSLSMTYRLE